MTTAIDGAGAPTLLHHLVERQARMTPDAAAVTCLDTEVSYRELDEWASQLARSLARAGVGQETPVAVIAERCAETVVALLAVLKSGGTYVPIDPANPSQRFHYLMRDSGSRIVVTPERLSAAVPDGEWTVVYSDREQVAQEATAAPPCPAGPDSAAYVIYTSGSTGEPKGVVVPHRQIVYSTLSNSGLGRPDPASFLLLISFSFDASAVGLYWALSTGGQVVIPTQDQLRDIKALQELLAVHRVTHLDCTPALYSLILSGDPAQLATLRCAIVGGEACPRELIARHYAQLPDCLLVNNYGPTETTVWATTATLVGSPAGLDAEVPIGLPPAGVRTHVLDEHWRPVPPGGVGELYIAGSGVARGYHGRSALTALRFLPDPWASEPGGRMYRTGDRVHVGQGGALVFRGRVDDQVKVRGFRIELGEVEQALLSHPAVGEAAAVVRDQGGTAVLAAWVAPADAAAGPVDLDDVRAHVSARLPAHMVPTRLGALDALPRNVAGKVDRGQLPDLPEPAGRGGARPMTPLEAEVAELVGELLGVTGVGAGDSIFDLGATSLHMSRLLLAIWSRFQVTVMLHNLFQLPTVAGISQMVELGRRQELTGAVQTWSFEQLAAAGVLADDVQADGLPRAHWLEPRHVFLTGVTGYLGAFLAKELIERTSATIWCLVRAASPKEGMERIRSTMRQYRIWDEEFAARLRAVPGDLAEPLFGLRSQEFGDLAHKVDVIFHSGALVNFLYPYSEVKAPNVDGTETVLRLATTAILKAVHHVSTIDVWLDTEHPRPFLEDLRIVPRHVPEGYARSKLVAEELVHIARQRGVPCSIYRPGMMVSHTDTGATQLNDFLLIEIKGLLDFGVVPDVHYMFDAVPIDYSSKAIAHIALREGFLGRNFHLWNLEPIRVERIFEWIRSFGYVLNEASFETVIQHLVAIGPGNAIFPLIPLFLDEENRLMPDTFDPEVVAATDMRSECANTLAALDGSGITCPPMTEDLAHRCFRYLVEVGFFPEPDAQRSRLPAQATAPAASGRQ
jgi:amino acid adenylation domain-containing protein/thioester reductase-like protein